MRGVLVWFLSMLVLSVIGVVVHSSVWFDRICEARRRRRRLRAARKLRAERPWSVEVERSHPLKISGNFFIEEDDR